jgi:hypothetical protein
MPRCSSIAAVTLSQLEPTMPVTLSSTLPSGRMINSKVSMLVPARTYLDSVAQFYKSVNKLMKVHISNLIGIFQ